MGDEPPRLGEPLKDDQVVYRAFAAKGFRERPKRVRAKAFYRWEDHEDGLSLGLTPEHAVAGLEENFGYCSILVGEIRRLPYGLEVRPDLNNPGHILLCGIPYLMQSDRDRGVASEIAGALARISKIETCDPYPPKETGPPPLP